MNLKKKLKKLIRPSVSNIGLYYWSKNGLNNFGDQLSRDIVEAILIRKGMSLKTKAKKRLLALGSIIQYSKPNTVIWGSGINFKLPSSKQTIATPIDIRAVRGPLTKDFLQERGCQVPSIYGDPALLLKELYPGLFTEKEKLYEVSVLPNLNDIAAAQSINPGYNFISPNEHWINVLDAIQRSHLVLTSSLHGVILCDLINVDYRQMVYTEIENLDKYKDYYMGSGRTDFNFYRSTNTALSGSTNPRLQYDHAQLLKSFPYDVWTDPAE